MGSWSENCGFSGMEIGEGDVAYVAIVGKPQYSRSHGPFDMFEPKTTLLRGTYNDYGYLHVTDESDVVAIFNEQSGLDLKCGDDFSIDHMAGEERKSLERWWIHGKAFDFLPSIKPEFPYAYDREANKSIKVKDIQGAADRYFGRAETVVEGVRAEIEKISAAEGTDEELKLMRLELAMLRSNVTDALGGYSETRGFNRDKLWEDLNASRSHAARLTAWRRVWVLEYAMSELRKKLVPSERVGPQHDGFTALDQFGAFLRRVCREERAERAKW